MCETYKGYEIYAVCPGGYWHGCVYKAGKRVHYTRALENEGLAYYEMKRWINEQEEGAT